MLHNRNIDLHQQQNCGEVVLACCFEDVVVHVIFASEVGICMFQWIFEFTEEIKWFTSK